MELNFTVIYSQRKKLAITVERDRSVVVHAPIGTDPSKISQVVESRKQWIYEKTRHAQKYEGPPTAPGKELVNGESLLYLGRQYRIEMVDSDAASIRFSNKFLVPKKLYAIRHRVFNRWYFSRAEEKILPRIHLHAKSMGIAYNQAKIVDVKYRWGSCTLKDNLNFNWRLIKAPMFVVDYVIVHELAHLLESNHTPRFWNIVRAQSPTMDKAKQWLKEHGELLETEI